MSMTYDEMIKYVNKNDILSQLYISAKYLLKNEEFELSIEGLSSHTNNNKITIGYPYKLFEVEDEKELFRILMSFMGHEAQHLLSSSKSEINAAQEDMTKDLRKKGINRYTAANISNSILNSLEDARIENILVNNKKGFSKYIKYTRYKLYTSFKLEQEELYDVINTIYIYSTTGLLPIGFNKTYDDTRLNYELNQIKDDIDNVVYAKTCKECMKIGKMIENKIKKYLVELVQKDEGLEQDKFIENTLSSGQKEKQLNINTTNSSKINENNDLDLNQDDNNKEEIDDHIINNAEFYKKQNESENEDKKNNSTEETKDDETKDIEKYYVERGANPNSSIDIRKIGYDKNNNMDCRVELPLEIKKKAKKLNNDIIEIIEERKRPLRRNQKRGIIDFNNLYRFDIFDDGDIFIKKAKTNKYDTVFYFLVDGSGSMKEDNKWQYAVETMSVLEEALKEIVKIKVVVFNTEKESIRHLIIKDFDDNLKNENLIYTNYSRKFIIANGANKDGANIRIATKELEKRKEKQKILFVLSDGMPSAYYYNGNFAINDVKMGVKNARSKNIKVISIMFGSETFKKKYYDMYKEMYEKNIISTEPSKICIKIMIILKDIFANG